MSPLSRGRRNLVVQHAVEASRVAIPIVGGHQNLLRNSSALTQHVAELHTRDHGQILNRRRQVLRHALVGSRGLARAAGLHATLVLGEHGSIHTGMQANLNHIGIASLLDDARALAVDIAHVVDVVKAIADLSQIIVQGMRDARLASAAKNHAAHLDAKELSVLAAAQELDDLVLGVQVLDHNERLIGTQRKETRKVHGAVGGDLNRLHADALFGHTPN